MATSVIKRMRFADMNGYRSSEVDNNMAPHNWPHLQNPPLRYFLKFKSSMVQEFVRFAFTVTSDSAQQAMPVYSLHAINDTCNLDTTSHNFFKKLKAR